MYRLAAKPRVNASEEATKELIIAGPEASEIRTFEITAPAVCATSGKRRSEFQNGRVCCSNSRSSKYILLDVLLCNIAELFLSLTSP